MPEISESPPALRQGFSFGTKVQGHDSLGWGDSQEHRRGGSERAGERERKREEGEGAKVSLRSFFSNKSGCTVALRSGPSPRAVHWTAHGA